MRTASIGALEVSVIGVGCNNFGRALDSNGVQAVVDAALDAGMNFFDTSDNYGNGQSERLLAEALGTRRADVVIATKFGLEVPGEPGSGGAQPDYIRRAAHRSLSQLGTDWIDLYQLHKPDPNTPIEDTMGTLWELVDEGLVREIGCSNLDATQLVKALDTARDADQRAFVSNQIEYSLLHRAPEANGLTDVAGSRGVSLLPFYPLASGMLTGKASKGAELEGRLSMERYHRFLADENFEVVERLRPFAADRHLSMVQVALGWLLAQPRVPTVTPGATTPAQIHSNGAAARWFPTAEDLALLDEISPA